MRMTHTNHQVMNPIRNESCDPSRMHRHTNMLIVHEMMPIATNTAVSIPTNRAAGQLENTPAIAAKAIQSPSHTGQTPRLMTRKYLAHLFCPCVDCWSGWLIVPPAIPTPGWWSSMNCENLWSETDICWLVEEVQGLIGLAHELGRDLLLLGEFRAGLLADLVRLIPLLLDWDDCWGEFWFSGTVGRWLEVELKLELELKVEWIVIFWGMGLTPLILTEGALPETTSL